MRNEATMSTLSTSIQDFTAILASAIKQEKGKKKKGIQVKKEEIKLF